MDKQPLNLYFDSALDIYSVHPPHPAFQQKLSSQQANIAIKKALLELKIPVFEYSSKDSTLTRSGFPGDHIQFLDVLDTSSHVGAVTLLDNKTNTMSVAFSFPEYLVTEFQDDDIYSTLYTIVTQYNISPLIYNDVALAKKLVGMQTYLIYDRTVGSAPELIMKYLNSSFEFNNYVLPNYMRIDASVLKNLHPHLLFSPVTKQGRRLLDQFIRQPQTNIDEICLRNTLVKNLCYFSSDAIRKNPDIIPLIKKRKNITDFIKIMESITNIDLILEELQKIHENFSSCENMLNSLIIPFRTLKSSLEPLRIEIDNNIVEQNDRYEFRIDTDVNILEDFDIKAGEILADMKCMNAKTKLSSHGSHRYCFKVPRSEYEFTRKYAQLQVLKSGVTFINRELNELNMEYQKVFAEIDSERRAVCESLGLFCEGYSVQLRLLNHLVAYIDVLKCFGMKLDDGYVFAELSDTLYFEGLRNPFVFGCVENNYPSVNFLYLTGPNMGGKSTLIKSVALSSLLRQMGCPVPCKIGKMPVFDGIYMRSGCNDNPMEQMSTFMVEMTDIARILKNATNNSLVIVDELGRGTSEIDGHSIASAVAEHLMAMGCITLWATHFTHFDFADQYMMKSTNGKPEFKLVKGVSEGSWGIEIVKLVNMPPDVIEFASQIIAQTKEGEFTGL